MKALPADPDAFAELQSSVLDAMSQLTEVVKSDLAELVIHRRTVLDIFSRLLGQQDTGRFALEDVLHRLFFPRRTTSDAVDYDEHNLWLIDERLAYHKFLASDVQFSRQAGAPREVESDNRPDLVIYNHPFSYSEDGLENSSIVVVEFKRPERDDYSDTDNPIDQVLEYVEELMEGRAVRKDGSRVTPHDGTPFYCHVIVSLTPKLRTLAKKRGFFQAPDGQGYFAFNPNFKTYIELTDYRKVMTDALKRNKAFFHRLGLHTGASRPEEHARSKQ